MDRPREQLAPHTQQHGASIRKVAMGKRGSCSQAIPAGRVARREVSSGGGKEIVVSDEAAAEEQKLQSTDVPVSRSRSRTQI